MGNYISCRISSGGSSRSAVSTKVVIPSGEIRVFHESVKAAEVMLEIPNFFVLNTNSLHIGRRFSALNADQDLEVGNVYVMFPMKRLNSTVTSSDMAALFLTAVASPKPKPRRQISGGGVIRKVRIQPADHDPKSVDRAIVKNKNWQLKNIQETAYDAPKLNLDDIEDFSAPEFMHRLSMCRSKKPLLETIVEEPPVNVCSQIKSLL